MTSNTRVPKTEITGIYGALVKKMTRKMLGEVPEAAEVMWQHPAVFKDTDGTRPQGREVEPARPEPGVVRGTWPRSALVGCSFCLDLGYFMAHNRGLDEAKAREVPRWRESDVFTPLERRRDGVRRGDEPDPTDRHRRDVGRAARGRWGRRRWWS